MIKPILFRVLSLPLRLIPGQVHSNLVARACNHLLRGQALGARLSALNDKILSIHITDIPIDLRFTIRHGKLRRSIVDEWDTRISGELASFWLLATRAEDPDTLFFNRRLNIEGDTETGLYLKNILDSFEFDLQSHFSDVVGVQPPKPLVQFLRNRKAALSKYRPSV